MLFHEKVVLVTGASSGIGAAIAEYFAKNGAFVAITGRSLENLEKTKVSCKKVSSHEPLLIQADVTKDAQRIISETISHFNRLDVLVNNAGVLRGGSVEAATLEDYDYMMNTNVRAVFHLTTLAVPHLIASHGNVVNVSSVAGLRSFPNCLVYCMSKATIDQMTRCCALDLAQKGVRVNSVNPGVIITDIHKRGGMDDEAYEAYLEHSKTTHAMGRVGNVEEVVEAVGFFASNEKSSFITGATLPIDGGKHAMCPR
ncbi:uncharacterized oxidoreductase TM_0325-like [Culicoides brevitarsis]|uniref:uncharacterized oxidoreductase TM_0325-like n=1 Tax=Culicoides brevitarsis TaxID=469753 RepID=UPI00307C71FA